MTSRPPDEPEPTREFPSHGYAHRPYPVPPSGPVPAGGPRRQSLKWPIGLGVAAIVALFGLCGTIGVVSAKQGGQPAAGTTPTAVAVATTPPGTPDPAGSGSPAADAEPSPSIVDSPVPPLPPPAANPPPPAANPPPPRQPPPPPPNPPHHPPPAPPPPPPDPYQHGVHPGAFCSPAGALGYTSAGTLMRCTTTATDPKLRWRKA